MHLWTASESRENVSKQELKVSTQKKTIIPFSHALQFTRFEAGWLRCQYFIESDSQFQSLSFDHFKQLASSRMTNESKEQPEIYFDAIYFANCAEFSEKHSKLLAA